ncbi:cytochrome o ubiquinol oxidase subunit IV [Candidatus Pandoraea novymonadis]|uniref:Cytochrome bo(3) ubiquinol oxidase subunit 4 n=1 Tax=Candidatus Pandoraea novymonadis TaxID=1808959 RepID=A0ABX5FEG9_9BURK|nr:cytochrome o ubiquinol oxidase subunit IV [Candidatus Pandoraea novymonadis]PSB92106.1 Cytochrome bo(3) ubiquinol oxidase subunit 4 [Candidatus Pandoraea novymonadis]
MGHIQSIQTHDNTESQNIAFSSHGTIKSYLIGFVLSAILTFIPFKLVMDNNLPKSIILMVMILFATLQIVVHLLCFLHMDGSLTQRWNVIAFAFTMLIVAIILVGSLWIMFNANELMMLPIPFD